MKKIWIIFSLFAAGGNFERFMNNGTDSFFGTHWLLIVCAGIGLIVGWDLIPTALPPSEREAP